MIVHVGIINHKHGENIYVGLTRESLDQQIAAYCRDWWEKDGPSKPAPENDEELISAYFSWCEEIGGSEWLTTGSVEAK